MQADGDCVPHHAPRGKKPESGKPEGKKAKKAKKEEEASADQFDVSEFVQEIKELPVDVLRLDKDLTHGQVIYFVFVGAGVNVLPVFVSWEVFSSINEMKHVANAPRV